MAVVTYKEAEVQLDTENGIFAGGNVQAIFDLVASVDGHGNYVANERNVDRLLSDLIAD